jgi:hypothetical protein
MPIQWRAGEGGRRVDVTFSDPYSIAESERVMKEIFATPGIARPLRFLIDVRGGTPPDADFVLNATTFWQLHVSEMWGARIAIVAGSERQIGMALMSERSAESRELPFTVHVFHESAIGAAAQWLESA